MPWLNMIMISSLSRSLARQANPIFVLNIEEREKEFVRGVLFFISSIQEVLVRSSRFKKVHADVWQSVPLMSDFWTPLTYSGSHF